MDRVTYGEPSVALAIHRSFIPVRVDCIRRPDINARYNLGGPPTTAVLTPRGDLVTGGTYLSPEAMLPFLRNARIIARGFKRSATPQVASSPKGIDLHALRFAAFRAILDHEDAAHGGFGRAPKFPHASILLWLAQLLLAHKEKALQSVFLRALGSIALGELHDHAGGGFFRYCSQADWTLPHFEKTLVDNAGLIKAYASAYKLTQHRRWRRIAEKAILFTDQMLYQKDVCAYSNSQDTDAQFCKLPLRLRGSRESPAIDTTICVGANAGMCSALLYAATVFRCPALRERSLSVLRTLQESITKRGARHFLSPEAPVMLGDSAALVNALLDAAERTAASKLARATLAAFRVKSGGCNDIIPSSHALGRLRWSRIALQENALLAQALLRLGRRAPAEKLLRAVASDAQAYPFGASMFGQAVDLL